jgi:hypothetical protein
MTENKYKGTVLSFFELLNNKSVEIPIIQRDYAQGRIDKKEIRGNFLNALYDSLNEEKPIMLDFIYGSNVDNTFQPLDGQQRLTTLFLLHWYAFTKENKTDQNNILKNFSYETRITSRDFCNALVSNNINIVEEIAISKKIVDCPWFFLTWRNDPTIDAMLRTIDDIHQRFYKIDNLWDKLISTEKGIIRFYNVELKNIGLTDDLYIKMNARGKLLTPFENFKAGFQKTIIDAKWENNIEFKNTFACRIDTIWTDFFWHHFRKNNNIDDSFIKLISTISMVRNSVERNNRSEDRITVITKLQEDSNNVKPKNFTIADFNYLVECLNLYSEKYSIIKSLKLDIPFWRHTPGQDFLHEVVFSESGASYTQKALFFAQTEYFRNTQEYNLDKYNEWMRVVRNIVSRGDIEKSGKRPDIVRSPQTFDGVVNLISELSAGCADIYIHLASIENLKSTFAKEQIEEERLKARLIQENPNRKKLIWSVEDTDLLRGRINFMLHCIDYETSNNFDDKLFDKLQMVINKHFKEEQEVSNDLRRALLTIEVNGRYDFYGYWWSFWNVISSNKRCLIDRFREMEYLIYSDYRDYFKKLILELSSNNLKDIAENFNPPVDFPKWKTRLIKDSTLLDNESKSNYIAIPEDESCCYLLKSKRPRDSNGCLKIE